MPHSIPEVLCFFGYCYPPDQKASRSEQGRLKVSCPSSITIIHFEVELSVSRFLALASNRVKYCTSFSLRSSRSTLNINNSSIERSGFPPDTSVRSGYCKSNLSGGHNNTLLRIRNAIYPHSCQRKIEEMARALDIGGTSE